MIRASEVRPVVILALFDDAPPYCACPGEKVEQRIAVAPADCALERG